MSIAFLLERRGMNVFEAVKPAVTTKQAAEIYGISVKRNGMVRCPFHNDKNPSMKVDRRYHCFGCQADGDAIDFVAKLFGLSVRDAAIKLADDFAIPYDNRKRVSIRPRIREPTKEQMYQNDEKYCYRVLTDYFHFLKMWEMQYTPQDAEEEWHPLFVEALQRKSYIEYQIDILLNGSLEERKALVTKQKSEVRKLGERIAEWTDDRTLYGRRSAKQLRTDTER